MSKQTKPSPVQLAARIYGCQVEDLLSHRAYRDGSVVIIAPTGQKFTYSPESLVEQLAKQSTAPTLHQAAAGEERRSDEEACPACTSQSSLFDLDNTEQLGTATLETPVDHAAQAEPALMSEPSARGVVKKPRKPPATGKASN